MLEPRAGLGRTGPRALGRGAPTRRALEEADRPILWQRNRHPGTSRTGRRGRNRGHHQRRSPARGGPAATRLGGLKKVSWRLEVNPIRINFTGAMNAVLYL